MNRDELEQKRISLSYEVMICTDSTRREHLQKQLNKLIKMLEQEDLKEYNCLGNIQITDSNTFSSNLTIPKER